MYILYISIKFVYFFSSSKKVTSNDDDSTQYFILSSIVSAISVIAAVSGVGVVSGKVEMIALALLGCLAGLVCYLLVNHAIKAVFVDSKKL
jgi:hypothetical protein